MTEPSLRSADEILAHFRDRDLRPDERWYLGYNLPRFRYLLSKVDEVLEPGESRRVLDIGPGFQTDVLRASLPDVVVDSLGFENPLVASRPQDRHVRFDLNDCVERERWPDIGGYDVVLMAEVIEHLHTSAVTVLRFVGSLARAGGHAIVQTPNAAALHKRLELLAGRNPYGPISDSRTNPLHFREYTIPELLEAGTEAGLVPREWSARNYFATEGAAGRLYAGLGRVLPPRLRHGVTAVFARP